APRPGLERHSAVAEPILRVLVTVALDVEVDLEPDQPRLVEGHDAMAVGHVPDLFDRAELDQRDATSRLVIDDLDPEGLRNGGLALARARTTDTSRDE